MVGAEAASPQPTVPSAASIRTRMLSAVRMVMPDMVTGVVSGSATGMASTRRMTSGACAAVAFDLCLRSLQHATELTP